MRTLIFKRPLCICIILIVFSVMCCQEQVCAASVQKESLISNVKNPSNGVLKYVVTVPAGQKIDYSVELTPDKKTGTMDKISGSWKNKTKKTLKKTITVNVKYLSDKYKIKASYSKTSYRQNIVYTDTDKAVSSLKKTAYTSKKTWNISLLGKGSKKWTYRYKYVPCSKGYKRYLQVFDKNGKQIKNQLKEYVSLTKITKLINEMKAR